MWDRRGRDRIVVRFTTTYAISGYQHLRCVLESRSGEVFSFCLCIDVIIPIELSCFCRHLPLNYPAFEK
jgi:hypothetical protein